MTTDLLFRHMLALLAIVGAAAGFGLLQSGHCAAMCGPLTASVCGSKVSNFGGYLFARTLGYGILGTATSMIGIGLRSLVGVGTFQAGVAFVFAITLAWSAHRLWKERPAPPLIRLRGRGIAKSATLGLLSGILPCGALWAALALAAAYADWLHAALFMVVFSLVSSIGPFFVCQVSGRLPRKLWLKRSAALLCAFAAAFFAIRGVDSLINPDPSCCTTEASS